MGNLQAARVLAAKWMISPMGPLCQSGCFDFFWHRAPHPLHHHCSQNILYKHVIYIIYIYIVILLFFSCSYRLIPYYYGCYCSSYADIWHESQLSPGIHQETLDRYGLVRGNAVLAEAKHEALYEDLARLEHVPWWLRQGMVKMQPWCCAASDFRWLWR